MVGRFWKKMKILSKSIEKNDLTVNNANLRYESSGKILVTSIHLNQPLMKLEELKQKVLIFQA